MAAKYKPRSQRNRRRFGSAKENPAPYNGTQAASITVAGAGTGAANGNYTADGQGGWSKGDYFLCHSGSGDGPGFWLIRLDADILYTAEVPFPPAANPPKTGWAVAEGAGPAPTLTYL